MAAYCAAGNRIILGLTERKENKQNKREAGFFHSSEFIVIRLLPGKPQTIKNKNVKVTYLITVAKLLISVWVC